jgi:cysteine-rich repeat protein
MRRSKLLLSLSAVVAFVSAPALQGCGGSSVDVPVDDTGTPDGAGDDATQDGPNNDNPICGNGFVEGVEQCDDGSKNGSPGGSCQIDCTWTCINTPGNTQCDDKNPCNGAETCSDKHTCQAGTPIAENGSCGTARICVGGSCVDSSCGDGVVTAPEECDDGNTAVGDGCEPTCKFTCVAGDATRACPAADVCAGASTCSTTHTCTAGTPKADGTACGTGQICVAGKCGAATCGDGFVEAGEDCDFGAGNGPGKGCEATCKLSCASDAACADTNTCNGNETCVANSVGGAAGKKCQSGTNLASGTACTGGQCDGAGVCKPIAGSNCGNGTLNAGEQCDLGANNGNSLGCSATCQFECTTAPDSCAAADTNVCDGTMKCTVVTTGLGGTGTGQKCVNGAAPAACASCGGTNVCVAAACAAPKCGDGCVAAGEQCEPPNSATCSATCLTLTAAVCGNGKREVGEQCDDGNKTNTDGCDSKCQFEQEQRINSLSLVYDTSICTNNALGKGVVLGLAQSQLQTSLSNSVKDGSISILFDFLYPSLPHDLTGTNVSPISVGSFTGKPVAAPAGLTYDGTSDLDWWYTIDPAGYDMSTRLPTGLLAGTITAKKLSIPTGNLTLMVNLGAGAQPLNLSAVKLTGTIGAVSTPKVATATTTPGHLTSENLDPALQSFQTITGGQLCGNVSAYSLSKAPIPAALAVGGSNACNEKYPTTASLLDVFVGGCKVTVLFTVTALNPTQPDQSDPTAPLFGAGPAYTFTRTGTAVTGCKDKGGKATATAADFDQCLKSAAYSSSFKFTTDRVIAK